MSRYTWEFQKSFLRQVYNREVNFYFSKTDLEELEYNIKTSKKAVKSACLIRPQDTQTMVLIKMKTYREIVTKIHLKPEIYGIPVHNFKESYTYTPQVTVHFRETLADAKFNDRQPLKAQCTVRYKKPYNSEYDIEQLKNKIRLIFATGTGFSFQKGREHYYYRDLEKGYNLHCNALNKNEAVQLFNAMLEIQDDGVINEDFLGKSVFDDKNWSATPTQMVAGKSTQAPKLRPLGIVRFTQAEFDHYYLKAPILLK